MKRKACKNDKIFYDDLCPICRKDSGSTNWQGRIHFLDTRNSMIANKMNVDVKGEYAIKVR